MTNRTFGVEIECGFNPRREAREIADHLYRVKLGRWLVGYDGTYIEAKTPILRGYPGLEKLKKAMVLFQDLGGYVTGRDGLHVHHGAAEFRHDMSAVVRLVKSWHANRSAIEQMVAARRVSSDYCPQWSNRNVDYLEQQQRLGGWDRNDLNIASLLRHGTIEIRLHEGTLNFDEARAWILFGQKFIEGVLKDHTPVPSMGTTDALLKQIKLGYASGAFLREKAAHKERLQTQPRDRYGRFTTRTRAITVTLGASTNHTQL
jgi:hypothetical protein